MDPLDDLLRGLRAEGAVLGTPVLAPPYALRFIDGAALTFVAPLLGAGWIVAEGTEPVRIVPGDTAIIRGPEPFLFTDDPARSGPSIDVRCDGRVDSPGPVDDGTVLMAGAYHVRQELPRRLVTELPPLVVVPEDHDCTPLREYLQERIAAGALGRHVGLDRLLDWLMVCCLRDWFEANPPPWYRALGDDVAGPVLQAMHGAPAANWTLAGLAEVAAVSRTTLVRRFTQLIGQAPLTYLTELRMTLATDLLTEPGATVSTVARQVGYGDAFSFSSAFKRERGVSPSVAQKAGQSSVG
ncbi:AraC family transcriptional regulator [Kribbella albertanoniae]|uniref:AraC family transcriptional regulator n=1 Tax=Kribbella albertanoniae TaxID=1266829 RepID=A0A4R4P7F4_9ACTN|nr:AraC family transcriptional regulator [Kribbella albertanoniae]TDC18438.1 AraC family transcriptional regulator [Kribbella albertanoniae]